MNYYILILTFHHYYYVSTVVARTYITDDDTLTLELVQVLSRHGARTPEEQELYIHNSTLFEIYKSMGFGELTNMGKQQEYEFGKFLRRRYSNYLSSSYKSDELYAFASQKSRLQMSLQLILAGLYQPNGASVWDSHVNWTPTPYTTVPDEYNILIESHLNPEFVQLRDKFEESDEFHAKFEKFSDFINFVEERTLVNGEIDLKNVYAVRNVLKSNEYMGLPLPDWYTPEVEQKFEEFVLTIRDSFTATTKLRKLGPGPLIETLVDNMNLKNQYKNPRKMYLYSGHGTNVEMFYRAHKIKQLRYPPFGSAVILEKLRDSYDRNYVRLLAWDGLGHLETLKLGDYKEFCPIGDYLEIIKDVIPSKREIHDMLGDLNLKRVEEIFYADDKIKPII